MNVSKDGKTLYFSDEEIDNDTNGEKKVFVTKRINGEESHVSAEKIKKHKETAPKEVTFDFDNEIVIGVNSTEKKEEKKRSNNKKVAKHSKSKTKKERNKSKKSHKKILALLSSLGLIIIVGIIALTAPVFNITDIQICGNDTIPDNTILTLSGLKRGENIFRFNNSVIENIKENKYIDSVEITRKLPNTVIISVEERVITYQVNLINSYAYVDKKGYILGNSTVKKEVPVVVGLSITEDEMLKKERLKTEDLEKISKISKIMDATKAINLDKIITEINVEQENDYVLYIESKNKRIYIGDTSNLTNKMLYVQKILENEEGKSGIAFVNGDISSGFKPYFREE